MKSFPLTRIVHFMIMLALALGSQACEGPEGPPGPEGLPGATGPTGPAGPPGPATVARVIDFNMDFEYNESLKAFAAFIGFEEYENFDLTIGENDVVLVYLHTLTSGTSPNQVVFWSPLPKSYKTANGTVTYNFAYSELFLVLLAEADFDLTNFPNFIGERLFRMVIIPGESVMGRVAKTDINYKDYNAVAKHFNIEEKDVKKLKLK